MLLNILLYLWQLPQNLLGGLLVLLLRPEKNVRYKDVRLHYARRMRGGISLGRHIIVSSYFRPGRGLIERHEWGHTRQSLLLGPLYLPVIGLPSLLWATFHQYDAADPDSYFRFYTEKWADALAGIQRGR